MKLRFLKTGGFAGLSFGCEFDTEKLSKAQADELVGLVKRAALERTAPKQNSQARDLTNYEIVVEQEGKKFRAVFDDMTVSENARGLLEFLSRHSKAMPLDK